MRPFVCGYKRSAIACVPKFYWTGSLRSSNIEVVPTTSTSPKRVAMTGSSPRDVKSVGGWLAVLTHSHWDGARRRWQRRAAYVLLAQAAVAIVVILGVRDGLAAEAMVGLLFPVALWVAVRMWRVMTTCSLIAVAVDDIAVSIMLGLPLMALLVWLPDRLDCRDIELLADALHIPPAGVATVRETLRMASKYAELPQRWWIGLYVLLVGVSVLFAVRPGLLPAVMQWFPRLQIGPSFIADHGVATAVHIGLLGGAVAPSVVAVGVTARPLARYSETLAENLRQYRELGACTRFLGACTRFHNAFNARPAATPMAASQPTPN
jgi:hypothetical protein